MRLRTLTEAECYARCYGGLRDERVTVVRLLPANPADLAAKAERDCFVGASLSIEPEYTWRVS